MANNGVKMVLTLGSNCEQEHNVRYAMERLRECFPGIKFSRILWTEPIGIESDKFVNALAIGYSNITVEDVIKNLKAIERECGRCYEDKAKNIVRLDIDLLQYGELKFREEDWEREYVQLLLKEL